MRYAIALCAVLASGTALAQAETTQAYDLLFKEGTLDGIDDSARLIYSRTVRNAASAEAAERDTGDIALTVQPAEGSEPDLAMLEFRQGEKFRGLGTFPASIGNPMIMYFMETTARDMGETAGGSPFYIRNRLKESLLAEVSVKEGRAQIDGETVETQTVTLHPFEGDPNRDQMRGFGAMTLTVTMSDEVPGWYVSLVAEAMPEKADVPVYRSALQFKDLEEGKGE